MRQHEFGIFGPYKSLNPFVWMIFDQLGISQVERPALARREAVCAAACGAEIAELLQTRRNSSQSLKLSPHFDI
ncbi:hypothetical protein C5750_21970 [Phyllobacterium myrsinacearum]|uniref:Uncharacterized protein n=1 Tax=Phyllobacterium myrsinacearum TaxID=28101 RepID=A0A2S9JCP9_9HYPH|nr:hypothetical protein C5750_21970 [Phyllobacterium myrsinacearum]